MSVDPRGDMPKAFSFYRQALRLAPENVTLRAKMIDALLSAGELPEAVETAGISVRAVRWAGVLTAGALAGVGGAYLSVVSLGLFVQGMSAGRGFIALAAVIFGRWRPFSVLAACLVFGGVTSSGTGPSFMNWDGSGLQQMPPTYHDFDAYSPDGSYAVGPRFSPHDSLEVLFIFKTDDVTGTTYRQLTSYRPPQEAPTAALSPWRSLGFQRSW